MTKKIIIKTFEERYKEEIIKIDQMNLTVLKNYRIITIEQLDNINNEIKELTENENDNTIKRKKFLKGLKENTIKPILIYIKKRQVLMNRVINNGITLNFANRFVITAFKILSLELFQKIYGLTLNEEEKNNQTIDDIKKFMIECENKK